MLIRKHAFARAGLVGNPSDGYFGKTISFIVKDFRATITLYESPEVEILPNERDHSRFHSIAHLSEDVSLNGYYGGIRLLKATVRRFHRFCQERHIHLHDHNFTLRYESDIPPRVGMAGSSAIITACLRALMEFYSVGIPRKVQASLILSVENEELGIPAGLQDRVIQAYEGLVFMDFEREHLQRYGYGRYEELDPECLPPLYIAYSNQLSEGTEVFHNDIRGRFNRGEPLVVDTMRQWADLADQTKDLLLSGRGREIGPLLDRNFDLRCQIYQIGETNLQVVKIARQLGASCKFTGSGGAFVGTYENQDMFLELRRRLEELGLQVIQPSIVEDPQMQNVQKLV